MRANCDYCGRPIAAKRYVKYCSDACKMKAYRRRKDALVGTPIRNHERLHNAVRTKASTIIDCVCEMCGQAYTRDGNQALQMYCSDACKQKAYRARRKEATQNWSIGMACFTDTGRDGFIKEMRGTRACIVSELVGGRYLDRYHTLKRLTAAPVQVQGEKRNPRYGDLVEIHKEGDFNHAKMGRVVRPSPLAKSLPQGHVWVQFESDHPDGGVYFADFGPTEIEIVETIEHQDAKLDVLLDLMKGQK